MSEIKIYDMRSGTEVEITNGELSPYPVLRKDSLASSDEKEKVIPMKIKAAPGYRILSTSDTAEGGIGCQLLLQHNESGVCHKCHWWINDTTSVASSSDWVQAAPWGTGAITLTGGADSSTGTEFWLKCDCESNESIGVHDYATLSADGIVASVV